MKRASLPVTACTYCNGQGQIPDTIPAGEMLRREREERDVPRISKSDPVLGLAFHFGFSESYTLDLERGVRPWSWNLIEKYRNAIEKAVESRLKKDAQVEGKEVIQ